MSPNRRIALNILATYGRSLYALVIGLFCGRWALMALGHQDFGLYGVVGGMAVFISFFNELLAMAVSRFYAFSIGEAKANADSEAGLENCRHWFSLAVAIHTIVPLLLIAIGYPVGLWAVRNFLVIPPDRVSSCIVVFHWLCLTCFVSMVNVPFKAMYTAKQYIAELTIYSFVTSTLNVVALYWMVSHPGFWLEKYAAWMAILAVSPHVIICIRALMCFPECRFRIHYCFDRSRFLQLLNYSFWQFFAMMGNLCRTQGIAILINKYFGPKINATMNMALAVSNHSEVLASAMNGAFAPAITTSAGAGDDEYTLKMAYRSCKYGSVLCLMFTLPLLMEIQYVITAWL